MTGFHQVSPAKNTVVEPFFVGMAGDGPRVDSPDNRAAMYRFAGGLSANEALQRVTGWVSFR